MTEEIKFEKAMERLSKIVEELEAGEVSLEEALKKYEEGVKLSRSCHEQLSKAEKKIEVLTKSLDGTFVKQPFEYEESEASGDSKKEKKPSKDSRRGGDSEENKDLLI